MAIGHAVMIGVMAMTPVHLGQEAAAAGHGNVLRIIGIVISLHIVGMYAFSPVVGWAADRLGRRFVIVTGLTVLLLACAVAGTAGHDTIRLTAGLGLLGVGWSCTLIAGSTLLTESVPLERRPAAQGLADLIMGIAGALAGAVSGFVVEMAGYPMLTVIAALLVVPVLGLALRQRVRAAATISR